MNPTENLIQRTLFAGYLDPTKLKEGKEKCPCCGKNLRAYAKNLDKRLISDMILVFGYACIRSF